MASHLMRLAPFGREKTGRNVFRNHSISDNRN